MSLKAGRVGVNPADVNPVNGKIQVEVPDNVYTKTQADNKFETKTHATSTYATKTEAEQLQPKTLAVPIEMLSGSKFTVESALQGLQSDKTDTGVVVSAVTNIITGASVDSDVGNELYKHGPVVNMMLGLSQVTASAWASTLFNIPEGYRPRHRFNIKDLEGHLYAVYANGNVQCSSDLSNAHITFMVTWMTE